MHRGTMRPLYTQRARHAAVPPKGAEWCGPPALWGPTAALCGWRQSDLVGTRLKNEKMAQATPRCLRRRLRYMVAAPDTLRREASTNIWCAPLHGPRPRELHFTHTRAGAPTRLAPSGRHARHQRRAGHDGPHSNNHARQSRETTRPRRAQKCSPSLPANSALPVTCNSERSARCEVLRGLAAC